MSKPVRIVYEYAEPKNKRPKVGVNATMAVIQVLAVSAILFVLYKFLLRTIGVRDLGIWSVVLATTSAAGVSGFGLSGSVTKFVAKYLATERVESVSGVIQTAFISIGAFSGLVLLLIYPLAKWILSLVIPSDGLEKALAIFPYAVISFWGMMVTGVLQSGLDGCQRIDIRSILVTASAFLHLVLAFLLVPSYGLIGLAYARVVQTGVTLCAAWLLLKREIPTLPMFPMRWNARLFREMIGYGLNFQIISISQMLCEPVTKGFLSKFGGLDMVGFYEMANRMFLQFRMLFVSANQVLVPAIADIEERAPSVVQNVYISSYRLMLYLALPSYSLLIAATPLISELWIGEYQPVFVGSSLLLGISLFINTLNAPAYFTYLGTGHLKWNAISHVTTALFNALLGLVLGSLVGGWGVVSAWVVSSIAGSVMIAVSLHISYRLSLRELLPAESLRIALLSFLGLIAAFSCYFTIQRFATANLAGSVALLVWAFISIHPIWIHPQRMRLTSLVWAMQNKGN